MSAIGNVIGQSIDAMSGHSSGTSLQDFLSQFSSADGVWAKTIDPFTSFDMTIKFYPSFWDEIKSSSNENQDKNWKDKLSNSADSIANNAKNATKNAANNLTGGLLGSIMNGKIKIMDAHKNNPDAKFGDCTFMEYLAAANLIVGKQDWIGENAGESVKPLELQLGLYCQEVTIPNFEIPPSGTSQSAIGEFPINGIFVKPDTNILTMKIVNTKVPLHERIFYPWMREVVSPMWHYRQQPYTTATITIDLTKHSDVKYIFCGCRPQKIMMQQATQDSTSNLTRDVSFLFDCMLVHSGLNVSEAIEDKLFSTGKTLLNGATKMINM